MAKETPAQHLGDCCRSEGQHIRFCTLVRLYAREPLPLRRKLRYQIGRVLCGTRPFETFREAEKFVTELISGSV